MTTAIKMCARAFVERAEELGLKGKRRDDDAIAFVVGYTNAAKDFGAPDLSALVQWLALLVCTRGYKAILDAAKEE